ncbi:MAG: hypothetical protein LBV21_01325 [Candidatus Adiutrix sp.]|jgi:transcriptional regulator GlxA family with amidase domain|nr:hypothetical protein [Candidatus Adiutrix sp.]
MTDDRRAQVPGPQLRVGFTLTPDFTLLAFTGFIETLRQAADLGDLSRPIWCSWSVMSHDLEAVKSSCGLEVRPWETFRDPRNFDYVVLVGGLLSSLSRVSGQLTAYLAEAVKKGVPIIACARAASSSPRPGCWRAGAAACIGIIIRISRNAFPAPCR